MFFVEITACILTSSSTESAEIIISITDREYQISFLSYYFIFVHFVRSGNYTFFKRIQYSYNVDSEVFWEWRLQAGITAVKVP